RQGQEAWHSGSRSPGGRRVSAVLPPAAIPPLPPLPVYGAGAQRRRAFRLDRPMVPPVFASLKAPRCPQFFVSSSQKIGSPASRSRGAGAALTLTNPDDREVLFSTGERFNLKEDHPMTAAHRILNNSGELRIESGGQVFAEDELCEAL